MNNLDVQATVVGAPSDVEAWQKRRARKCEALVRHELAGHVRPHLYWRRGMSRVRGG